LTKEFSHTKAQRRKGEDKTSKYPEEAAIQRSDGAEKMQFGNKISNCFFLTPLRHPA